PVDLEVAGRAPGGDDVEIAVPVEVGHLKVLASHAAIIEGHRRPRVAGGARGSVDPDAGATGRVPRPPPAGDDLILPIAVEVRARDGVPLAEIGVDHAPSP